VIIESAPVVGTYPVSVSGAVFRYYSSTAAVESVDGSITITKSATVGGVIEGTFSGTATGQDQAPHAVSEGRFRVARLPDDYFGGGIQ